MPPLILGWREWIGLPDLKVERIKAKVDTGARTSALHAWDIHPFRRGDNTFVKFVLHPIQRNNDVEVACTARVIATRYVRSSIGQREKRYVIQSTVNLVEFSWPIEITLTNRDEMGFRMLLGRSALHRDVLVAPRSSYRLGKPKRKRSIKKRSR